MDEELSRGELLLSEKRNRAVTVVSAVLIALLAALMLFYLFFGCAVVDGHSMENNLHDGQRAVLLRRGYTIERGDIITVKKPTEKDTMLIKRVIGLGGDRILYVRAADGAHVDLYIAKSGETAFRLCAEPYIKDKMLNGDRFSGVEVLDYMPQAELEQTEPNTAGGKRLADAAITVPSGEVYFLGDNRNNSTDSRFYGASDTKDVTGKVIKIIERGSALEGFMNFMFSLY